MPASPSTASRSKPSGVKCYKCRGHNMARGADGRFVCPDCGHQWGSFKRPADSRQSGSRIEVKPVKAEAHHLEADFPYTVSYIDTIDGDTIDVKVAEEPKPQHHHKIRLHGIDAPEIRQPYGVEAKLHLHELITKHASNGITLTISDATCTYGRYIGVLTTGSPAVDLNRQMVADGFARASFGPDYEDTQKKAQGRKTGIWVQDDGGQSPAEYRKRGHRRSVAIETIKFCPKCQERFGKVKANAIFDCDYCGQRWESVRNAPPKPIAETKPALAATTFVSSVTTPAPAVTKPTPVATKPGFGVTTRAPAVTTPAAGGTKLAPAATTPAPAATKPTVTTTKFCKNCKGPYDSRNANSVLYCAECDENIRRYINRSKVSTPAAPKKTGLTAKIAGFFKPKPK